MAQVTARVSCTPIINSKRQKLYRKWIRVSATYVQREGSVTYVYAEFSCVELPQEEVPERQKHIPSEDDPG